jgi:IS30 family transposase
VKINVILSNKKRREYIKMSFVEDIKILALKNNISISELARRLGESPQNFTTKLKRNSIKDIDLQQASNVMGYQVEVIYRDKNTGKEIYKSKL